jgi:hypothetical protein
MTTRKAWFTTIVLTLTGIGVALVLAILAGNSLLSAPADEPTPTPFTAEHCAMSDRVPDDPDCPTPTPVPCADYDDTCRVILPPECFPWPDDEAPYPGWPCVEPPTPTATPVPTPVSGPTDLPATGGEPSVQPELFEKVWCKGRTSGVLEACAIRK